MFNRKTINLLVMLGTAAITFLFFFRIIFKNYDKNAKEPVNLQTAAEMPVVVVSGGEISLLPYREIEEYITSNPDHTFLLSEDQEENFRRRIQNSPKRNVNASWTFKVEQRSPGKQHIWVSVTGNRRTEGWYEAADKSISPLYIKRIGFGEAIVSGWFAFLLTGLIWPASYILFTKIHKRISNKT